MAGLQVTDISNVAGDGPVDLAFQSAAKVWASIDFSTATILGSTNVSSVTDNATGNFDATCTNAASDTNGALAGSAAEEAPISTARLAHHTSVYETTSIININTMSTSSAYDYNFAYVVGFGDLA